MPGTLRDLILSTIDRDGPITFERFMRMALYEPGMGYYTKDATEIGRAGDFYTSPHLHPIFGAMIARQLEEFWAAMGRPASFTVVEMGGGRGYLCHDVLSYISSRPIFQCIDYTLIELNPAMMERQHELLGPLAQKVRWASGIRELKGIRGAFISNELVDAFPVHIVTSSSGELREVFVTHEGGQLKEVELAPSTPELAAHLEALGVTLPEGYHTEINLDARRWIADVAAALEEGFVLTIDYGHTARQYYDEERSRGTLMCYHQHQINENPYANIGEQDITAHVDFTTLSRTADGLRALGYTRQGLYLLGLGLDETILELYGGSPAYQAEASKILGLVMPGAMGDSHKVLVQYKGDARVAMLRGFSIRNLASEL